jgi:hypothetical protein
MLNSIIKKNLLNWLEVNSPLLLKHKISIGLLVWFSTRVLYLVKYANNYNKPTYNNDFVLGIIIDLFIKFPFDIKCARFWGFYFGNVNNLL